MNTDTQKLGKKNDPREGDYMRVTFGPLEGAEGLVIRLEHISPKVCIVEVRQENGNVIRLPRKYWEFAGLRPKRGDARHRRG